MTTTSEFQVKKDVYDSKEERDKNMYVKYNTNPRYSKFCQTHFTAGDEEQFQRFKSNTNGNCGIINAPYNMYRNLIPNIYYKYDNINPNDVTKTFRYIFHKYKKGIFVKIVDGKLKTFLPFSKNKFINEWEERINIDKSKYNGLYEFISNISKKEGRKFNKRYINKFSNSWYSNNSLLRFEFPISENDTNNSVFKNLLEELCSSREVPDVEFFLNRRDFPILKNTNTEPYNNIWDSKEKPLVSHSYEKYCPILSMSKTDDFADILSFTFKIIFSMGKFKRCLYIFLKNLYIEPRCLIPLYFL